MQDLPTFIANHSLLAGAALAAFILLVIVELLRAKKNVTSLAPTQVTQMINRENATVIDIRSKENFKQGHIIDASNLQSQDILQTPKKLEKYRVKPIIMVCQSGNESQKMATTLMKQGYNAYSLNGGMRAWVAAQMPIVKD